MGATLVHETGPGVDILGGAVKRDDSSSDTLYFKVHVAPLSDVNTEEYFAAFELYAGETERFGVGNASKAWAYSAFFNTTETGESNAVISYIDLRSAKPEPSATGGYSNYEFPRRGTERTIIFKVQYVAGGDDLITAWLNPDLGPGANEVYQPEALTTRFSANASFDEVRLRHGGGGGGWIFSEMAIATSFGDFVDTSSAKPVGPAPGNGPGGLPFSFQSWQREMGMPRGPIRALAQTPEGYLWLGSDDGVSRFDGVRFVAQDLWNGAVPVPVDSLLGSRDGELWVGTAGGGLIRYSKGQPVTYTVRQGLPSDSITALAEDRDGRLWVGTDAGLAKWEDGNIIIPPVAPSLKGKSIMILFADRHGGVWAGAAGMGICLLEDRSCKPLTDPSLGTLLQRPHCLLLDRADRLWVAVGDDLVLCREREQWHRYRIPRHTVGPYVTSLVEEPDGTVWAGSVGEGLFQFKQGKVTPINASSGLHDNLVRSMLVDRQGKLWVGTDAGLNRIRRKTLFRLGQEEGLGYGAVLGVAEVAPGEIWAARGNEGLYRWEGRAFNRLTAFGLPTREPDVNALLVARDGSCWVASSCGLLQFKDPQAVADESVLAGLSGLKVISLAEDVAGNIWAGTLDGALWQLSKGKWTRQLNPWKQHAVTAIVPVADGTLWVGTEGNGLYQLRRQAPVHLYKTAGLSSDSIRTLLWEAPDTLWIGTAGGGLCRWREGAVATFTTREGLAENTVSQILADDSGRLWLGGNRGIACVNRRDLDELAAGRTTRIYTRLYDQAEGSPSGECTSGFFPAGLKSKSGLLWFSAAEGIAVVDPRHNASPLSAPTVVLEEIAVDGNPVSRAKVPRALSLAAPSQLEDAESLRVPPGSHRFEFQYTAMGFDSPEETRFRYRLESLDADWVEAGPRRTAFYNYVPPGNYRFRVSACGGDGIWYESSAGLPLTVAPHFWQSWWVGGLAVVGMLVGVGGSVRFIEKRNSQRRLKRLEQEKIVERERTRIARDLHDEMGAKLCRISFLTEHSRRDENLPAGLRQQIASISEESRDVLHSLDEIVWAVNPHNDTVEHAASYIGQYAHEYFQRTGIECELDMPAQLPPHPLSSQTRHHLFLAVREALANILKHSQATRSKISVACRPGVFEIAAWDNGHGFDKSTNGHLPNGAASLGGNGLLNMRQRMAAIGGFCQAESTPGGGTTIRFVVPLEKPDHNKAAT